jgi:uncharacterized protein YegJ (DUF2314 family)
MREPKSNIGMVCPDHAPKVEKTWAEVAPIWFVGKYVKRSFPVTEHSGVTAEHMWIRVFGYEGKELVGRLDNDPQFISNLRSGATVRCALDQIEAVLDGNGKEPKS